LKVLISTVPFARRDVTPLQILSNAGIEYVVNPLGRKFKREELHREIANYDGLIAGTEVIDKTIIQRAQNLKLIARVGIGLDNVDLIAARDSGVEVCYTPDAPSPAVAELTVAMMLTMLRQVHVSNQQMHNGVWHRYFGRRLSECSVGIIGAGRIGRRVLKLLSSFDIEKIFVNDIDDTIALEKSDHIVFKDKEAIYEKADIISIHVPLTKETRGMIGDREFSIMKEDTIVINTSRGGIVDEAALFNALGANQIGGAAIDVFETEPYEGNLKKLENCLLTAHMGSMSVDCRTQMEIEATEDTVRFLKGEGLKRPVPMSEYRNQEGS